jgi:hypothetical protein
MRSERLLLVNTGSSSVKLTVWGEGKTLESRSLSRDADVDLAQLAAPHGRIAAVTHRVVHAGDVQRHTPITRPVEEAIENASLLAPLHNGERHGVVEEEGAHHERQQGQGGEVGAEGARHLLHRVAARPGPHHLHALGQERAQGRAQAGAYVDRAEATLPADVREQITRKRRAGEDDAAIDPLSDPAVKAAVARATFELLVGFQLTEQQLAYNATR